MKPEEVPIELGPDATRGDRGWLPAAGFTFIILALLVLAITPSLMLQRVARVTDDITSTLLPAYDAMRDYAFAMEQRIAAARSRFIADDPLYDVRLDEARQAEDVALRDLEEVAVQIGPGFKDHLQSIRHHAIQRDSLEALVIRGGEELELYQAVIPRFDELRDSMVVSLIGLRDELGSVTEERIAENARWTRMQRTFSLVIGVAAVLAALLVAWFALRQRRLRQDLQVALRESIRQRALAERRGDELERATEARARLLRGVTHDVKNPLGAARGYAELLQMEVKAPLLPEQAPFVEGIQRSIDSALAIIADLLDLARADSGGLTIRRVEADLRMMARVAVADHRSAAEAAGHTIETSLQDAPLNIHTDPARVEQVLGNLISNAIKYTPSPGRIVVSAGVSPADAAHPGGPWGTITVADNGPGIPEDQREAVFDEFTRLTDDQHRKGHGLGLAIARRIARLLEGDLIAEEAEGGGAAFILLLPMRSEDQPGAPAAAG